MDNINLEKQLAEKYKSIFKLPENRPEEWAVKKENGLELVHPAIPFVGEKYSETKVLLYASAENLSDMENRYCYLNDDNEALHRRRDFYNKEKEKGNFFPSPHIQPVADGALVIASAYILKNLGKTLQYDNDPYKFIEHIAVDNFCKFTIKNSTKKSTNKDYARDIKKLRFSFEYVNADLEVLKPEIIIMPYTIYETIQYKDKEDKLRGKFPECSIIPIYQMNSRNINHRKRIGSYLPKDECTFVEWQKHLEGISFEKYKSVYTYLDKIVENFKSRNSK